MMAKITKKFTALEFVTQMTEDVLRDGKHFVANMDKLKVEDDTYCEWIQTFSAWMEWREGDCENFHDYVE